jgi:predicted nucleotidyltransferase
MWITPVCMRTLNDVRLTDQDRKAIEAASRLLIERFPAEKVILFGSKARGDDDSESDIDLLVFTARPWSWPKKRDVTYALFDVEMEHDVVVSTLIATRSEWEEGYFSVLPIHEEILNEGAAA